MNLNTIAKVKRPASNEDIPAWREGCAWLAGGTWLFSTPQIATHTLIDLETLRWPSLTASADGLEIGATCTIAEIERYKAPAEWTAAPLAVSSVTRSFGRSQTSSCRASRGRHRKGDRFDVVRKAYLSPRSVGVNVQGVPRRGSSRDRRNHAVAERARGRHRQAHQSDAVPRADRRRSRLGFGWTLYEKMVFDGNGAMVNPALRDYRIPAFADVPRSEVYFAETCDSIGPLGAKAQGECAINCVAPAIANAIADATGVRFPDLPLTPDRIFSRLAPRT